MPVALEDRSEDKRVKRVRSRPVRIVAHDHVAGLQGVDAQELDGILDAEVVGTREDRDAGRLSDRVALGVVQTNAVVMDLVDDGVVRRAAEVASHLLGGRQHGVPDDLRGDRVDHVSLPFRRR